MTQYQETTGWTRRLALMSDVDDPTLLARYRPQQHVAAGGAKDIDLLLGATRDPNRGLPKGPA
jgi:hypothetical protein